MEQSTTETAFPAKRPIFLTVLCILSFVGIGISLLSGIYNYITFWSLLYLIQTLFNLPILFGVFLMWKQKKLGYFIYAPLEIIQAIIPLFFGLGFLVGGIVAIISLIFPIIFVVLYGLNLKHMYANAKGIESTEKPSVAASGQKQNQATASIAGSTFYEARVSNVTCIPVGTTYKVGLTVTAKKFSVDSKTGNVKEEMINDEIQIGMLKDTKEIYLKSYKFTKTITALNLTLDQKPDKIGIDPYNKLPEKA